MSHFLDEVLNQNRDYSPKTPPGVLKEFIDKSVIYQDFLGEMAVRIEAMRDYYEDCDSKQYLETRGAIKVMRMVTDIFNNLLLNAEDDQLNKENDDGR